MNSGASFNVANCNQDLNDDPEETNQAVTVGSGKVTAQFK